LYGWVPCRIGHTVVGLTDKMAFPPSHRARGFYCRRSASGPVTAISAGEWASLALQSNGTVMAWGGNEYGQLGHGTKLNSDVPLAVSGLSGVTAISAGAEGSLAYGILE